jgi:hypothetical protein
LTVAASHGKKSLPEAAMTEAEVEAALVGAIQYVQTESRSVCPPISGGTRPIGEVAGFDSLNGVEAGAKVAADTGLKIPDNPFVDERGQSLSIKAAAQRIAKANANTATSRVAGGAR